MRVAAVLPRAETAGEPDPGPTQEGTRRAWGRARPPPVVGGGSAVTAQGRHLHRGFVLQDSRPDPD